MYADIALVLCVPFGGDVALGVVTVDGVAAHPDALGRFPFVLDVGLDHHVVADHAAGFADVNLVRPVAVVGELVVAQPPLAHLLTHLLRHPLVVGDEVQQPLLVVAVFPDDLGAALVAGLRVVVVHADVVEAEGAVVIHVRLAVRDFVELAEGFPPAGVVHP